jgi:hypothetical protein
MECYGSEHGQKVRSYGVTLYHSHITFLLLTIYSIPIFLHCSI